MTAWFLLYCKRGEQQRAVLHLNNQGVECYFPEIEVEKVIRGKRQTRLEPLFPSYVFIELDLETCPSFTTLRSTRGVVDFVRFGGKPYQVPESLIEDLQLRQKEAPALSLAAQPGQNIQIKAGQFAGFDAIYQEMDGEKRSFLLITLINQQVKISVDNRDVIWQ